jgi:thioredoxin-like negative regulator of GroEL
MQVDVAERIDLVEKLAVLHVPTLVLVVARKVVARIDGRASAPKIEAMLAEHLAPEALPA